MPNHPTAGPEAKWPPADTLRTFWRTGRASWAHVQGSPERRGRVNGRRLNPMPPAGYVHGNKIATLTAEAARRCVNPDTLAKAWRVGREYTEAQIDELCGLVARHRARFGPTHLSRLLAIKDRRRRDALALDAVRGRWGLVRLQRAIQAVNGRRPHVGKRPTVPVTRRPELLLSVAAVCDTWERFCGVARDGLSEDHKKAVSRATRAVREVKRIAERELPPTAGASVAE